MGNIDRHMGSRIEPLDGSGKEQRQHRAWMVQINRIEGDLTAALDRAVRAEAALAEMRTERDAAHELSIRAVRDQRRLYEELNVALSQLREPRGLLACGDTQEIRRAIRAFLAKPPTPQGETPSEPSDPHVCPEPGCVQWAYHPGPHGRRQRDAGRHGQPFPGLSEGGDGDGDPGEKEPPNERHAFVGHAYCAGRCDYTYSDGNYCGKPESDPVHAPEPPQSVGEVLSEACGKWIDLGDGDGYECDGEKGHPDSCEDYPDEVADAPAPPPAVPAKENACVLCEKGALIKDGWHIDQSPLLAPSLRCPVLAKVEPSPHIFDPLRCIPSAKDDPTIHINAAAEKQEEPPRCPECGRVNLHTRTCSRRPLPDAEPEEMGTITLYAENGDPIRLAVPQLAAVAFEQMDAKIAELRKAPSAPEDAEKLLEECEQAFYDPHVERCMKIQALLARLAARRAR